MSQLFYFIYRILLGPLSRFAFRIAGLFNEKIRLGLELRKPQADGRPAWMVSLNLEAVSKPDSIAARPVWIHCASGEFEYAKPIVASLKAQSIPVLITYFSPSYKEAIEKFPGVTWAVPLPWDTRSDIAGFIKHFGPRVVLFARTDVWPEVARQVREHQIPSLLFSATLTERSGRARGLGRWMSKMILSELAEIWCVSPDDKRVFAQIGLKATVQGDTRFDQVIERVKNPKVIRTDLFQNLNLPVFVAGSTWGEDEAVLIMTISKLRNKLRFVLVPHEPTEAHLAQLESRLQGLGIQSTRYSSAKDWASGVLIVDKTGILAELYRVATFAFVGGSFKKTVHSVMEPLAAGALTFVGPLHTNNREALEMKNVNVSPHHHAVEVIANEMDLEQKLIMLLKEDLTRLKQDIQNEIAKRQGASQRVVAWATRH